MLPEYYDRFSEEYKSSVGALAGEFERLIQSGPDGESIALIEKMRYGI